MAESEFETRCLSILDEVNRTGEAVLVTRNGEPIAQIEACYASDQAGQHRSLLGFMSGMATIPEGVDLVSSEHSDEEWDRMAEEKWDRIERENPLR